MPLHSFRILPLLVLMLYCYSSEAQSVNSRDSFIIRYATDTCRYNLDNHAIYLIQFLEAPAAKTLQQYGVKASLSRYHYILQQQPADSSIKYCYIANNNYKAGTEVLQKLEHLSKKDSITIQIGCTISKPYIRYASIIYESRQYAVKRVRVAKSDWESFISQPSVLRADIIRQPSPEIIMNTSNLALNQVTLAQEKFTGTDGRRITVSVKEDRFDTTDIDLQGRIVTTGNESASFTSHALIMATLIGGAGNSGEKGKGVAPSLLLSSSNYSNTLLPDDDDYYSNNSISIQNHSYGTTIENFYGAEAAAYDQHIYDTDTVLHVFSSGNIGNEASTSGPYSGLAGYANLSGNFKQAKNILVTGATDAGNNVTALSSKGPAYDGRIKPELVAFGEDGTSGAAAITSGTVALLQDMWLQTKLHRPVAALIKALLINSAYRPLNTGPSFSGGYGSLNSYAALQTLQNNQYIESSVNNNQSVSFHVTVPVNMAEVKVTLCWTDPPAAVNSSSALVNDLDLTVTAADGSTYLPWVLSSFPGIDSLGAVAVRGKDNRNNTEQVTLPARQGDLQINVKGAAVQGHQRCYIVYSFIPQTEFTWLKPAPKEILEGKATSVIQWQTSATGTGTLSYSVDEGVSWRVLDQQVSLQAGSYSWQVPDTFSHALLRISATDSVFKSEAFMISPRPAVATGLNCEDSALIYWTTVTGAASYQLYTLQGNTLVALREVRDTSILLAKKELPGKYVAVNPLTAGKEAGLKSYTIQYERQGVDCYIAGLLADKTTSNQVLLSLTLGTLYNLKEMQWERFSSDGWRKLGGEQTSNSTHFSYLDEQPPEGIIYYRVKLITQTGKVIYSDAVNVVIFRQHAFLLYPVPAYNTITLVTEEAKSRQVVIRDMAGRTVLQQQVNDLQTAISLHRLGAGVYNITVYENGVKVFSRQIVKL